MASDYNVLPWNNILINSHVLAEGVIIFLSLKVPFEPPPLLYLMLHLHAHEDYTSIDCRGPYLLKVSGFTCEIPVFVTFVASQPVSQYLMDIKLQTTDMFNVRAFLSILYSHNKDKDCVMHRDSSVVY